jgi:hypothetical protein
MRVSILFSYVKFLPVSERHFCAFKAPLPIAEGLGEGQIVALNKEQLCIFFTPTGPPPLMRNYLCVIPEFIKLVRNPFTP